MIQTTNNDIALIGHGAMEADDNDERADSQVARLERRLENVRSVCGYLEDLITMGHEKEPDQSSTATPAEGGRHRYIPLGRSDFVEMLLAVKQLHGEAFDEWLDCAHCGATTYSNRTFVDVGCGLGDKVVLAAKIGYEAHGIEVDLDLVRRAKEKYPFRECLDSRCSRGLPALRWRAETLTLYPVDAMTFDYSGFDVIYFYCPFRDSTLEAALERRIWRQAKPGAYVLACGAKTTPPPALGFREIKEVEGFELPQGAAIYVREASTGRGSGGRRRSSRKST